MVCWLVQILQCMYINPIFQLWQYQTKVGLEFIFFLFQFVLIQMKEGLRKLIGANLQTEVGNITLSQTFREDDCQYDQLHFTTQQESLTVKVYDIEKDESIDRFHRQKEVYSSQQYDELADTIQIKEIQIKKVNFGAIVLKIPNHCTLREIANNLSNNDWLTLTETVLSFSQKLKNQNQVFLNLHPSSISKNINGEFRFTDPEFLSQEGSFQDLSMSNELLMDMCEKQYRYRSPQLLDQYSKGRIDYKSDLFSYATVIYEMLYHDYPFESKLAQINCSYKPIQQQSFFKHFIQKLLKPYHKRQSIQNLKTMVEAERKKVPKEHHVKAMNSGSTAQSKGSSIFSGLTQMFSKLTTETQSWYLNFTENDENRPQEKYLNLMINKLYKKEAKIDKLQSVMIKYLQQGDLVTHQNQYIKTLELLIQLFRRGPNFTNHQWEDIISTIEGKSVGNAIIAELCHFCRHKISFHQKYKHIFRGNFYIEDLAKFKLLTFEVVQDLQVYLSSVLQSIHTKLLFLKKEKLCIEYARQNYCDQVLDLISTLIFSVLCIRKDNELQLRKDPLEKLKQIEKKLNHQLKKISYLSNHINAHAIYSVQGEFVYYQEEIQLKETPYHTSLEHFYKNCQEYKGLCIPQNFALSYSSGDHKEFLSNQNLRVDKSESYKQKNYFANEFQEGNDNSFKNIQPNSPQKIKMKEQFLELLKVQKPKKQTKKINESNIFELKSVKSKEQQKKTVKFDDFFKLQTKNTIPKNSQFVNFDKKITEVKNKNVSVKNDFSLFNVFTDPNKTNKPTEQVKEQKVQPNFNNFFQNFGNIKQREPKAKEKLVTSSSQKIIQQSFLNGGLKKPLVVPTQSPFKPKYQIDPIVLNDIFSGLKLKELKQIIIQSQQIIIQFKNLKLEKVIGSGSAGQVYLGKYNNQTLAIKKVKTKENPNALKEFQRELLTYIKIKRNPHLVSLVGLSKSGQDYYLLTQFCNSGSLFDLLHKMANKVALSWKQRIALATQIAKGMLALHQMKPPIIHRDLKSLNVFVIQQNGTFQAKVADFGLSRSPQAEMMTMYLGTLHWMAPQLLDNKQYSIKVDIYSFAVVLWQICARKTPYNELSTPMAIIKHVTIQNKRPNLGSVPPDCPPELIELMKVCWAFQPADRPCFKEIIDRLSKINVFF